MVRERHRDLFSPPRHDTSWQHWRGHDLLRRISYLYFFVDNRLAALLLPPGRSYPQYLVDDFVPGSREWSEFERYFHNFATRARTLARRRIVLLYPMVPYRDQDPLKAIHDRMQAMTGAHTLSIPPAAWRILTGTLERDQTAPWHQQLRVAGTVLRPVVDTEVLYFPPGLVDVDIVVAADEVGVRDPHIATLQVVDAFSNQLVTSEPIQVRPGGTGFQTIPIHLSIPGDRLRRIRYRIASAGHGPWRLGAIQMKVDYDLQVVDLAAVLNGFDTRVSLFDSHPNARAQQVIADYALCALDSRAADP